MHATFAEEVARRFAVSERKFLIQTLLSFGTVIFTRSGGDLDSAWTMAKATLLHRSPAGRVLNYFYVFECFVPTQVRQGRAATRYTVLNRHNNAKKCLEVDGRVLPFSSVVGLEPLQMSFIQAGAWEPNDSVQSSNSIHSERVTRPIHHISVQNVYLTLVCYGLRTNGNGLVAGCPCGSDRMMSTPHQPFIASSPKLSGFPAPQALSFLSIPHVMSPSLYPICFDSIRRRPL